MTALAANRTRHRRHTQLTVTGYATAIDSEEYYEGQLLCFTASAGTVEPASDTSGNRIAGVCTKRLTTGASTAEVVEFEYGHLEWFPQSGLAAGQEALDAVVSDDNTLTDAAAATNDIRVGRIAKLETIDGVAGAWVWIAVHGTAAA